MRTFPAINSSVYIVLVGEEKGRWMTVLAEVPVVPKLAGITTDRRRSRRKALECTSSPEKES